GGSAYGSYEELVASDVDAIYVATPHPMHEPNTLLALNADKAVLCEKPFAVNAAQSSRMIALAKQKGLLLVEAMWSRFLPHYRVIRQLIAEGQLGEIISISADHGQFLPLPKHYRLHAPESELIAHQDSQDIMEIMDQIRSEIGVKYPFE
ncbi:MAG: gfo/Idh/MocA family oxidoreductase, partial [Actinobacteria bacterium]|nr:gfo/Idh/MocA family oxidoreductase [Actinomycetota bacterium]